MGCACTCAMPGVSHLCPHGDTSIVDQPTSPETWPLMRDAFGRASKLHKIYYFQWFQQIVAEYSPDDTLDSLHTALVSIECEETGKDLSQIEWFHQNITLRRLRLLVEITDPPPDDHTFFRRALQISGYLQNQQFAQLSQ